MRTAILKLADRTVGRLLLAIAPAPGDRKLPDNPRSFLFIRPGGMGDAVHLIPSISAIRRKIPDSVIHVLAESRNSAVFGLVEPEVRVFHYDSPADIRSLLGHHYDIVVDTEQWHRLSAFIVSRFRGAYKVGFATNERARVFDRTVQYSHERYEVQSFMDLVEVLGISTAPTVSPYLKVPPTAAAKINFLPDFPASGHFAVLFPGASIVERKWGAENFGKLASMLSEKGIASVVVGGRDDIPQAEAISSLSGGPSYAGRLLLEETAAVIDRSSLVVSGDSGILHVAAALGRPTVSLFGPGREKKWAPQGERHIVLNRHLDCSPCTTFGYTPKCPLAARCVREISVKEVFDASARLLNI